MRKNTCTIFFVLLCVIGFSQNCSEKDFIGTYGDTTCFRASECCISTLKIKHDHTYVLVMKGINHGHKNKSKYFGTWKVENDIIVIIPNQTKKNIKDGMEMLSYRFYQNMLIYENEGKFDLENIAYRKHAE